MRIKRVFDILGPRGFVPNGINWKNTDILWEHNFYITHDFINRFNSTYTQNSVYDCNLNLPMEFLKDYHISDLHYNESINKINNSDETYFYTIHPFGNVNIATGVDISYHQNVHCFDSISKKAIEYSKADNFYFIFDYSSEGDIQSNLFKTTHDACKKNNIEPSKVIVITSSRNTFDIYKEYIKEETPSKLVYTSFYPWSLLAKSKDTNKILFEDNVIEFNGNSNINTLMNIDEFDDLTNRDKKCLCLNRRLAPHRLIIISYLINEKLFDDTMTSFDMKMLHREDAGMDLVQGSGHNDAPYIKDQDFKNSTMKGYHQMSKMKNNSLDYDDINSVWGFGFESSDLYKKTYFSITTETLFYELGDYISEKTWKPIAHLHPFVFVGRPGILKYLKELGFKTFSDFWDESYDDIDDNSDRMDSILTVIKSLISKSTKEWDLMNIELKPILEHNRNILLSYQDTKVGNTYIKNLKKLISNEPNQENHYLL